MFGAVNKGEYDQVVKANNELRAKMEKLRLENAQLKDQVRALSTLPPEQSSLYVFIQPRTRMTIGEIKRDAKFAQLSEDQIKESLGALISAGLLDTFEKATSTYYSAKMPDLSEAWVPKGGVVSSKAKAVEEEAEERVRAVAKQVAQQEQPTVVEPQEQKSQQQIQAKPQPPKQPVVSPNPQQVVTSKPQEAKKSANPESPVQAEEDVGPTSQPEQEW